MCRLISIQHIYVGLKIIRRKLVSKKLFDIYMSFKDFMTYKRILIWHIYTSVISWWYAGGAHTMLLPPLSCARGNAPSSPTSLFSPASSYLLVLQDKQHQGQFQSLLVPAPSALVSSSHAVLLEVKTICSSAVLSFDLSQSGFLPTRECSEQLSLYLP